MPRITFEVDELDAKAIHAAIADAQSMPMFSQTLPDYDGDLGGAILAEICRGWAEWMGSLEDTLG